MQKSDGSINHPVNRRSFIKNGAIAAGAATVGAGAVSFSLSQPGTRGNATTARTEQETRRRAMFIL